MDNTNFNYWLKGYFELLELIRNQAGLQPTLSHEQVKCIREHLQLVQNNAGSLASFASWLQGYLDALVPNDGIGVGLDTKAFLTIDAKLTDSFKHHGAGVPTSTPYTFTSPFMQTETSTVSYC